MKKIISSIGSLRLSVISVLVGYIMLSIFFPLILYITGAAIFMLSILNIAFVTTFSEHMMLRLLYDKYNKYDVYLNIRKGTWKQMYQTRFTDSLAFILFDKIGAKAKLIPATKMLSYHQQLLLDHFPTFPHIEENCWVKGKHTSVMIMRKGHTFQYKNEN